MQMDCTVENTDASPPRDVSMAIDFLSLALHTDSQTEKPSKSVTGNPSTSSSLARRSKIKSWANRRYNH